MTNSRVAGPPAAVGVFIEVACAISLGSAIVALHGGGGGAYRKSGLSIQVRDIVSACKEIEAGGGKIALSPQNRPGEPIKLAEVMDTEGNAFSLTQYIG